MNCEACQNAASFPYLFRTNCLGCLARQIKDIPPRFRAEYAEQVARDLSEDDRVRLREMVG